MSAEPSRKSPHQAAKWTTVFVAQRAMSRLTRELNLACSEGRGRVGDEAVKKYSTMFHGPLALKAIAAICAATHLENGCIVKATVAMATKELAAQVDVAA
jgi:hypothetical protein